MLVTKEHYPSSIRLLMNSQLLSQLNNTAWEFYRSGKRELSAKQEIVDFYEIETKLIEDSIKKSLNEYSKGSCINKLLKEMGRTYVSNFLTKTNPKEYLRTNNGEAPKLSDMDKGLRSDIYHRLATAYKLLLAFSLVHSKGVKSLSDDELSRLSQESIWLLTLIEHRNSVYLTHLYPVGDKPIESIQIREPCVEGVFTIFSMKSLDRYYSTCEKVGRLFSVVESDLSNSGEFSFTEFLNYLWKSNNLKIDLLENSKSLAICKIFEALRAFAQFPIELRFGEPLDFSEREMLSIVKNSVSQKEYELGMSSLIFNKRLAKGATPWNIGEVCENNPLYRPLILQDGTIHLYLPLLTFSFLANIKAEIKALKASEFDGTPFENIVTEGVKALGASPLNQQQLKELQKRLSKISGSDIGQIDLVFFWREKVFLAEIKSYSIKPIGSKDMRTQLVRLDEATGQLRKKLCLEIGDGNKGKQIIKEFFNDQRPTDVSGVIIQQGFFNIDEFAGFPVIDYASIEGFMLDKRNAKI